MLDFPAKHPNPSSARHSGGSRNPVFSRDPNPLDHVFQRGDDSVRMHQALPALAVLAVPRFAVPAVFGAFAADAARFAFLI